MSDEKPDRPGMQTSASLAALRQLGTNAPSLGKIITGANSFGATALLTFAGYTYNSVHSEWEEMRNTVEAVRHDLDRMPTQGEFDALKRDLDILSAKASALDPDISEKIDNLRSKLIVIEGLCCAGDLESPVRGRLHRNINE